MRSLLVAAMAVCGCNDRPDLPIGTAGVPAGEDLRDPIRAGMVIDLQVSGGAHAGRYHVETMQGSCSRRLQGRGSWAIRYEKEEALPSAMWLSIPDAAGAEQRAGESVITLALGGARWAGNGTAVVRDQGGRATVRVEAQADGIRLEATVRCNNVVRVPGVDGG